MQKFKNLWESGFSAHLDLDTHSGQAWVGLCVRLGHHHLQQVQQPRKTRNGPSRQRRQARREAAKKVNDEDAEHESEAVKAGVTIDETESEEISDPVAEEDSSESTVVELEGNKPEAEEATLGVADKDIEDIDDIVDTIDSSATVVDELCPDAIYDNDNRKNDHTTVVHAVATFRNSPNDALGQDDINSLQNYIYSEEHLKRNIAHIEFEKISRWEVSTKLFVLTNNLVVYLEALRRSNLWKKKNSGFSTPFILPPQTNFNF